MGRGILVAHLDGPETGPGTNIEDLGGRVFRSEGGEVELAVHHLFDELILVVQAVELGGVIGEDVGCGGTCLVRRDEWDGAGTYSRRGGSGMSDQIAS